jgi:hypothetical protein
MSTLLTVALICAATTQVGDCTRDTAIDVVTSPASTPFECIMQGQTIIASGLGASLQDGAYLKVSCSRRRTAEVAATP